MFGKSSKIREMAEALGLGSMFDDESVLGFTPEIKFVPKQAGQIIAEAKVVGREAEIKHLAESVKSFVDSAEESKKKTERKEKEYREAIESLNKRLSNKEQRVRELGSKVDDTNREKGELHRKLSSIKKLLGQADGAKPQDTILELCKALDIPTPAPSADSKASATVGQTVQ